MQWCRNVDKKLHDNILVKFGYGVETTAGEKPAAFTWLERCNSISGLDLSTENIDASALEDYVTKYVAGRQDSGKQSMAA